MGDSSLQRKKLEEWIGAVEEFAGRVFDGEGVLPFLPITIDGREVKVIDGLAGISGNPDMKARLGMLLGKLVDTGMCEATGLIAEAWSIPPEVGKELAKKYTRKEIESGVIRPSQHPDRVEILSVSVRSAAGVAVSSARIIREGDSASHGEWERHVFMHGDDGEGSCCGNFGDPVMGSTQHGMN